MTEDSATEVAEKYDTDALELHKPPADVKAAEAVGYSVYDRVLGRFVGGVHRDGKPSADQAAELAGHPSVAIVRV